MLTAGGDARLLGRYRASDAPGEARSAAGLVSLEQVSRQSELSACTKGSGATIQAGDIMIDPVLARLKRMKCSVLTAQTMHTMETSRGGFRGRWAMVTLTYRPGQEWTPGDMPAFTRQVRKWCDRRAIRYRFVWVAELQQRGAVHYHVLIWLPKGVTMPKPDKQGWWPHGSTRIEWARCAGGYLAKYASKGDEGRFPKGCRIHAAGGMSGIYRKTWQWWKRPRYVREAFPSQAETVRRIRGGWANLDTGEVVESEWFFLGFFEHQPVFRRKSEMPAV